MTAREEIESIDCTEARFLELTEEVSQPEEGDYAWIDGMAVEFKTSSTHGQVPLQAYQPIYGGFIRLTPENMQGFQARRLKDA